MAEPTLTSSATSNFASGTGTARNTTASLSWNAGDFIVVLGVTDDNGQTLTTPTATGLTFSAMAGTPTNTANSCKIYGWTATAGSSGSSTVDTTITTSGHQGGVIALAYGGSGGLGNTSISASLGTTTTQSLIRGSANSAVATLWGDWNAVNDTTVTWTPSGQTQLVAAWLSGQGTAFGAYWGDQGGAGTTSYGFSGFAGGDMSAITVEILGTSGGGGRTTKNTRSAPLGLEVGMNWRGGNL